MITSFTLEDLNDNIIVFRPSTTYCAATVDFGHGPMCIGIEQLVDLQDWINNAVEDVLGGSVD